MLAAIAMAASCGSGKGGGTESAPPPAAADDGVQVSWSGFVTKAYPGRLPTVLRAVRASLETLQIDVLEEEEGTFSRDLEAVTREGTSLAVSVAEVTKDETRVEIKVGYLLGNRDAARRIHSEIEGQLASMNAGDRRDPWGEVPARPGTSG